ncbi:MAG: 2-oxoglutarate dehydrogenase E1 component [Pirellulaceae bacterium]
MNVSNQEYLEQLYEQFQQDPNSLSAEWQAYFARNFENGNPARPSASSADGPSPKNDSAAAQTNRAAMNIAHLQDRVDQLVRGFRVRGHLEARIDPLGIPRRQNRELDPAAYGFTKEDFTRRFSARTISGSDEQTLEEIVAKLRETYCRSIGAQFMHIDDHDVRNWLQTRMESSQNRIQLSHDRQIRILTRLTDAVIFEEFVRKKYIGAKTFSLEGGETLIPLIDLALEKAGEHGVQEVVLGMAHRGRLNVLANIMQKRAQNIFWSFDDADQDSNRGKGDVLYHMGYSSDWMTQSGKKIHISLCFNPSHLEYVNTVANGRCRSKQDRFQDNDRRRCMTLLVHGDAAFAGEGIIQETLNMSELPGYCVGGTLHVILNNQIGFTTPSEEGRSTTYASDVAKMLQIPIFHVNGEDPEAVAQVVELAMEFRSIFHRDVVIDMYCFRRLGHNESDEPRFTQPAMYQAIDARPTVREMYVQQLLKMQQVSAEEAERIAAQRREELEAEFETAKRGKFESDLQTLGGFWSQHYGGRERDDDLVATGISHEQLRSVFEALGRTPATFNVNRKLQRVISSRAEMALGDRPVDWATAELAAFASLAIEGHQVRLSGQDCQRGTFSQRHAVLNDAETGEKYFTLQNLASKQAPVEVINSPLCESGVLGFEYGYSLDAPESLILWEAQFGDFWNVAQVIVDQFISSAEEKWRRLSGLTLLLPHGFEGAGPEHCSARMERFLTLSAEHNMQIAFPTTAAQHFHLLRRQVHRKWRKPLVVFTPKSLLREPLVMSSFEEFVTGKFQRVLNDPRAKELRSPARILLCTGKIGVDLLKAREERKIDDVAIVRLEQLYPLSRDSIDKVLSSHPAGTPVVWIQEEPRNMGAWYFIRVKWEELRLHEDYPLTVISRAESASPSTGSKKMHYVEQSELFEQAFSIPVNPQLSRQR